VTPLYPQKLALTSPTGGGRSVGIFRVRTKATEFVCLFLCCTCAATFLTYFAHIMLICNYDHLWYLSVRFPGLVSCCLVFDRCYPDPVHLLLSPDLGLRKWPSPFPIPAVSCGDLPSGPLPGADCHSWHFRSAIAATRRSSS